MSGLIEASFTGLDQAIDAIERSLGEELPHGMASAAEVVADEAKAEHPFENRTGDLEASIHAEPAPFVGLRDLEARVVASMDYASYVEDKPDFAYLEPAGRSAEYGVIDATAPLDDAMQRAADDAGWKP
jgi:hypothetical protein